MNVDGSKLLARAFQHCRNVPASSRDVALAGEGFVRLLPDIVDRIDATRSLFVALSNAERAQLPKHFLGLRASRFKRLVGGYRVRVADANVWRVIHALAHDLRRLWLSRQLGTVHALGHAFHHLPLTLSARTPFDRARYERSLRLLGAHWEGLSPHLQQALCDVLELTVEQGARLLVRPDL